MPTLYVENIPDAVYSALREQAHTHGRSISAEVIQILTEQVPTREELARRRRLFRIAAKLRQQRAPAAGPFPATEEMLRQDRER